MTQYAEPGTGPKLPPAGDGLCSEPPNKQSYLARFAAASNAGPFRLRTPQAGVTLLEPDPETEAVAKPLGRLNVLYTVSGPP